MRVRYPVLPIFAAFLILLLLVGLVIGAYLIAPTRSELIIGLIIIFGVSVLVVLLFITASGFAMLGLSDSRNAMGLPDGSIRALIALFLIVIWVILSVYLFISAQSTTSSNSPQVIQLSQQLVTILGTLVVAISAFYFGSTNLAAARSALAPSTSAAQPTIQSITPATGKQGEEPELWIIGKNFRLPEVRLIKGNEQIEGTEILSSATQIKCKVTIAANQTPGKWDLIVVNEDGKQGELKEAFEVTNAGKAQVAPAPPGTPTSS